ncbi:MAG: GIY-YIG nuclease family protein [Patescibacteria group bacterium]|nr:GIY-YIG nuclease family protein [Patescibacteria group bacterium]
MKNPSFIYILTNINNTVLYTGVTSNLIKRIWQHKIGGCPSFTKKYNVYKLVYYEVYGTIEDAIFREKQIKGGSRQKKINLINKFNPKWKDLYEDIL